MQFINNTNTMRNRVRRNYINMQIEFNWKLLCNQGTIKAWKYDELIIKMPQQNILQL